MIVQHSMAILCNFGVRYLSVQCILFVAVALLEVDGSGGFEPNFYQTMASSNRAASQGNDFQHARNRVAGKRFSTDICAALFLGAFGIWTSPSVYR